MDNGALPVEVLSMASLMLVFILNSQQVLLSPMEVDFSEEEGPTEDNFIMDLQPSTAREETVRGVVLNHFRLWTSLQAIDEEIRFWVEPRSTAWFTKFLLEEYSDDRWVPLFRMTKTAVQNLSELLSPTIKKRDTNYRLAIPVLVRVACTIFKLTQGVTLLICSELFAISRSSICSILRDVVHAINEVMRGEISWPQGQQLATTVASFQKLCGLPGVAGAIDGTHFGIKKPRHGAADYYYFKSGSYTMHCQAVVDSSKRFLDLNVGMPGSTNDSRVLRRSTLFHRGQQRCLWDNGAAFDGFSPYLIGDAGFPLFNWLMVPHRRDHPLPMTATLFNRRLSKGRAVVENAFALLKRSFRELRFKSDLHVTFFPDVVMACAILHNVLLQQSHDDVERLLYVLKVNAHSSIGDLLGGIYGGITLPERRSNAAPAIHENGDEEALVGPMNDEEPDAGFGDVDDQEGLLKRHELGIYLSLRRMTIA